MNLHVKWRGLGEVLLRVNDKVGVLLKEEWLVVRDSVEVALL